MHYVQGGLRNRHLVYAAPVIVGSLMLESHPSRFLAASQCLAIHLGGMRPWETAKRRQMSSIIPQDTPSTTIRNAYCSHQGPHHNPPAVNFQIPPSSTSDLYFKGPSRVCPLPLSPRGSLGRGTLTAPLTRAPIFTSHLEGRF